VETLSSKAIGEPSANVFPILPPFLPMASYQFSRRFKLLGILLLSSIALLVYIRWHDILLAYVGPRPPLYEKARAKENSLPHYEEYKRKTVKYFLAANYAHGKKSRDDT
jgi:hypothetical protein